jgi:hypothetical protein
MFPGLAREDRENRRSFGARHPAGKQRHEEDDGEGNVTQHWHRLEDVEERDEDEFRSPALGCKRPIGDGEEQRGDHCRKHPEGRAQRVFRQIERIERYDGLLERRERRQGFAGPFGGKQ